MSPPDFDLGATELVRQLIRRRLAEGDMTLAEIADESNRAAIDSMGRPLLSWGEARDAEIEERLGRSRAELVREAGERRRKARRQMLREERRAILQQLRRHRHWLRRHLLALLADGVREIMADDLPAAIAVLTEGHRG
jgi:hypothetical protein